MCNHASGTVKEYIKEAIKQNLNIIGMSDHGPLPYDYVKDRMTYQTFLQYLKEIEECKKEFKNQIIIYAGVEIEYIAGNEGYLKDFYKKLDYLVLGPHFYSDEGDFTKKSTYYCNTPEKLYMYQKYLVKAMESGYFSFVAHPDLFMMSYPKWDMHCEKIAHLICEKAKELDIPLELNANGLRRGPKEKEDGIHYSYPREEFFKIAKEHNVKIIVNSDCHDPKYLFDQYMDMANEMAKKLDLDVIYKIKTKKA